MEPSPELSAIVRRLYDAMHRGDHDTFVNLFADSPDITVIGGDQEEWYDGFADWSQRGAREILDDIAGATWAVGDLRAWTEGTLGWAVDRPTISSPDRAERATSVRMTIVFRLVHGYWKIVNLHGSFPVVTDESGSHARPTTISDVLREVQEERPDLSSVAAFDGTVSILFSDIEGSTAQAEAAGDVRWLDLLTSHRREVERATAAHRGIVVKSLGDGFMLAFPSARRALECACDLAAGSDGRSFRVRMGVHTGEALRDGEDFFGHTVTMAARVAASAEGGEILASDVVRELVVGLGVFRFGDARTATLKGIAGEHVLHPVERAVLESG